MVNADLIEFIESTPDTLISLTTGRKIMVLEDMDDVIQRAVHYRSKARIYPVPTGGTGSTAQTPRFLGRPRALFGPSQSGPEMSPDSFERSGFLP